MPSETPIESMESQRPKALRMNQGKALLSFILDFPKALTGFARVKEVGAIKYDIDNWKKGGKPDREYLDAALRHMLSFKSGEQFASDTGCHHLSHAAWNLFALLELNVDQVVDHDLFNMACRHWRQQRDKQTQTNEFTQTERIAIAQVLRNGR
jgi:hypothetical protein